MIKSISCLIFAVCLLGFWPALGQEQNNNGNSYSAATIPKLKYTGRIHPVFVVPYVDPKSVRPENPTETNQVGAGEEDGPTFFVLRGFQTPGEFLRPPPPSSPPPSPEEKETEPVVQNRQRREAEVTPETTLIGKIRNKRTYCRKCGGGGGGGGGYYPQPHYPGGGGYGGGGQGGYGGGGQGGYGGGGPGGYGGGGPGGYGGYGGGGRGCSTCGGGGGGGSFSSSSSSSQSSAGGFGYGRK